MTGVGAILGVEIGGGAVAIGGVGATVAGGGVGNAAGAAAGVTAANGVGIAATVAVAGGSPTGVTSPPSAQAIKAGSSRLTNNNAGKR